VAVGEMGGLDLERGTAAINPDTAAGLADEGDRALAEITAADDLLVLEREREVLLGAMRVGGADQRAAARIGPDGLGDGDGLAVDGLAFGSVVAAELDG